MRLLCAGWWVGGLAAAPKLLEVQPASPLSRFAKENSEFSKHMGNMKIRDRGLLHLNFYLPRLEDEIKCYHRKEIAPSVFTYNCKQSSMQSHVGRGHSSHFLELLSSITHHRHLATWPLSNSRVHFLHKDSPCTASYECFRITFYQILSFSDFRSFSHNRQITRGREMCTCSSLLFQ